jgi:hypothetical protein
MDSFVALKRTDAFLPYNDRNLPDAIQGTEIRARFLRLQKLVLSGQRLDVLEREGGAHFQLPCLSRRLLHRLQAPWAGWDWQG